MNTLIYLSGKAPQPPPQEWLDFYKSKFYTPLKVEDPSFVEFLAWRLEFVNAFVDPTSTPSHLVDIEKRYEAWKEQDQRAELEALLKVQALWAFTWARAMLTQASSTLDEMFELAFPYKDY